VGVVRLFHGFFRSAEGEDGKHRAEDLLAGDAVALRDVGKQGGREIEAFFRQGAGGLVDLRAVGDAGGDEFRDAVELGLRVDRADVGVLVERVAGAQGFEADLEFGENLGCDGFLD